MNREIIKGEPLLTNRRGFLKVVTPGGWIPEYRKKGLSGLSPEAKIGMLKDTSLTTLLVPSLFGCTAPREKQLATTSFKEKVLRFKWLDAEKNSALESFTQLTAEEYLRLTQSPRFSKQKLIDSKQTQFFKDRRSYLAAVRQMFPGYNSDSQWGYTHFATGLVFIDLETLRSQSSAQGGEAGLALLDALWHEWGHLDIEERGQGKFINNPADYFYSPVSGKKEVFLRYRGGEIFTATYYGFLRFEEVWNETITVRRMLEQVGLAEVISAADYYQSGVNFFPQLTMATGISLDNLYNLHVTSDFEGLAQRIGDKLSGTGSSLEKGVNLFLGIHQRDEKIIAQSGALKLINK